MKKLIVGVAALTMAVAAFAQVEGDPNAPRVAFKQVGTPYPGLERPDQVAALQQSFGRVIAPAEGGFGQADYQWSRYSSAGFSPNADNISFASSTDGSKYRGSGNLIQAIDVDVPNGVQLDGISVYGYDNDASNNVEFYFHKNPAFGAPTPPAGTTIASYDSGIAATPGYFASFIATPASTYADIWNNHYYLRVWNSGTTSSTKFTSVVVWYHRRIAPGPAVATFSDVSNAHPFYKEIEALRASGITGGCTPTTFCPDATLTRAQMAAFLARALGLHWPYTSTP